MTNTAPSSSNNTNQQYIVSAAKDGGLIFFGRLFGYIGRLGLGILMTRFMGPAQYGVYALGDTILTLLTAVALLGLHIGATQYIPKYRNNNQSNSLWGTILLSTVIPFGVGVAIGIIILLWPDWVVRWFDKAELFPLLPIIAIALPFSTLLLSTVQISMTFKRVRYKVVAEDIVLNLIKLILMALLALISLTAVSAMSAHLVGVLIACGFSLYFLHLVFPLSRSITSARFHLRQLFTHALPVYISQLIAMFGGQLQILLLGGLSVLTQVGIYTVALRISSLTHIFKSSVVTIAMPYVSDLYSKNNWTELHKLYQTVTKWTFTANLPVFITILLFPDTILRIFGDSFVEGEFKLWGIIFAPGSLALIVLGMANLVDAATGIGGVIITMTERSLLNTINSALAFGSTLFLNLWLIPIWGGVGAAIAYFIAVTVVNVSRVIQVFVLYRMLPYNRDIYKPMVASFITFVITYSLYKFIFIDLGFVGVVVNVVILFAVYTASIYSLGLDVEDQLIISKFRNRFKTIKRKLSM